MTEVNFDALRTVCADLEDRKIDLEEALKRARKAVGASTKYLEAIYMLEALRK